jgi:hypothetical protein
MTTAEEQFDALDETSEGDGNELLLFNSYDLESAFMAFMAGLAATKESK